MIRPFFSAMNDALDDLIARYPHASSEEKIRLEEQWNVLKTLSDDIIELWLQFEDKMAAYRQIREHPAADAPQALEEAEEIWTPFVKGQGYFKLHMFGEASRLFDEMLKRDAELIVARLFLAMCRMHLGEFDEAQRHFRLIAATSDEPKLQAIAYNALGCVQAVFANLKQAQCYFHKAMETDPSFADPRRNLESCLQGTGQLQLQFGSAELHALVQT
ncbi:tetratricopeptide repeat protein [Cohnella nanjingensis]|uniref:Tetratricopeptide repeat protein n=1 Tax=Cohnella nanjingensis TaxID=1387779 RepID=A0A7X0VHN6_9BACL|nr:tetratricopeptide repeat protein [Cohnella nanjingensis]MBB6674096.1 hypothetical protein [Cohnella nanjingensis]